MMYIQMIILYKNSYVLDLWKNKENEWSVVDLNNIFFLVENRHKLAKFDLIRVSDDADKTTVSADTMIIFVHL